MLFSNQDFIDFKMAYYELELGFVSSSYERESFIVYFQQFLTSGNHRIMSFKNLKISSNSHF